jgi:Tol biopolymer transport system component
MSIVARLVFMAVVLLLFGTTEAETIAQPKIFAAQANWPTGSYASPTFTPDGRTMIVSYGIGAQRRLMISHLQGETWSAPAPAPFSGRWRDIEPAMSPDGAYLVFVSNRPTTETGQPLDGFYGGSVKPGAGGNLWRVDRVGDGWGQPARLPDVVNANSSIFAPALASNGDLIFMQPDPKTDRFRLYRSRFAKGTYATPEPLSFSDGTFNDYDPAVAPDGSFVVFSSGRAPAPKDMGAAIFVAMADGNGWRAPMLVDPILLGVEARLSADGSTLYFTTDRPTPSAPPPSQGSGDQKVWEIRTTSLHPPLSAQAARDDDTNFLIPHITVGEHFSNVFSITESIKTEGFDELVWRNGGSADSTLKQAGADQALIFDLRFRYDGTPAHQGENIIRGGGATSCWEGECRTYTDASGLLYNRLLWGDPPAKLKAGMSWNVVIDQGWELGPAGIQTVTVTHVDDTAGTVTLKREGTAAGAFANESDHVTLVKNGKKVSLDITPGQAHWSGYTTFRHGIVLSDELLVVRNDELHSTEIGTMKAVTRRYMLLNAAPYPTL